jgi:hypothetical protein
VLRFRHALAQLHTYPARIVECPEGEMPKLFANVYLTPEFISGHRKVVALLETELRRSGRMGDLMADLAYANIFDIEEN